MFAKKKTYRPPQNFNQGWADTQHRQRLTNKFHAKLFVIFGIPIVATILTLLIFRIYHVEGQSMEATLHDNQRVIVKKWDKSLARLQRKTYVPERFDIVVLKPPGEKEQVIKRVIGLPGERVIVTGGSVIIMNSKHPEGYVVDNEAPVGVIEHDERTEGDTDLRLEGDEVFVIGDNRQNSEDSRLFGPVKTKALVGEYLTTISIF